MDARRESEVAPMKNRTTVERKSERELVVTRTFNGPARLVFEAWTKPELFRQWWVPKSMGMSLLSCEMDVRVGGRYRLEFAHGDSQSAFFGTYKEVTPHSRLVWTNEESDEGSVTTVTFAEKGGKTLLVMHELYPSKEALDAAGTGAADAMGETFEQLDELLVTLGASFGAEGKMNAPTSITITPVRVADLLAEGERMPVYVHVIVHPDARVVVDTGMTELHPAVADLDPRLLPLSQVHQHELPSIDTRATL